MQKWWLNFMAVVTHRLHITSFILTTDDLLTRGVMVTGTVGHPSIGSIHVLGRERAWKGASLGADWPTWMMGPALNCKSTFVKQDRLVGWGPLREDNEI
jgi:hypothetical protein